MSTFTKTFPLRLGYGRVISSIGAEWKVVLFIHALISTAGWPNRRWCKCPCNNDGHVIVVCNRGPGLLFRKLSSCKPERTGVLSQCWFSAHNVVLCIQNYTIPSCAHYKRQIVTRSIDIALYYVMNHNNSLLLIVTPDNFDDIYNGVHVY